MLRGIQPVKPNWQVKVDLYKQQYLVSKTLCEGVRISKINSDLLMEVINGGNYNSVE